MNLNVSFEMWCVVTEGVEGVEVVKSHRGANLSHHEEESE